MHALVLRRTNAGTWVKVAGIALFALATALSSRVSVPLAFSPVPLTLQVLVVVLSGYVLGARGAFLAQLFYLQAVLLGVPATAAGLAGPLAFVSPTAGYLLAFPVAAAVAGWLSHRPAAHQVVWRTLGGLMGMAVIYGTGAAWLSAYVGGWAMAWKLGVAPFVVADLLKVAIACGALSLRKR